MLRGWHEKPIVNICCLEIFVYWCDICVSGMQSAVMYLVRFMRLPVLADQVFSDCFILFCTWYTVIEKYSLYDIQPYMW